MLMFNIIMKSLISTDVKTASEVKVRNRNNGSEETVFADYVFIGAGGGAIPLLQKLVSLKASTLVDSY